MKVFSSILGSGDGRRRGAGLRISLALSLLAGILSVLGVALVNVLPASAATTTACTTTAGGTTSTTTTTTTFVDGVADSYTASCYEQVGAGGTGPAFPSVTISAGTLPAGATFASGAQSTVCSTGNGNQSATATSGSGTTEFYIIECKVAYTPPSGTATAVPLTFTATPSACTGCTGLTAGNLNLNMTFSTPSTPTCIDPAPAGTSTTFFEGTNSTYAVECENTSGVTGVAAYPTQITTESGNLNFGTSQATFGGANQSTCGVGSGATTTTSGSGTTEDYILVCALADAPVASDTAGNPHNFTFQATNVVGVTSGNGTSGANSGTLGITVAADTVTCIAPASGGTAGTFGEGTRASYAVECEAASGISGVSAYPQSITINSGGLPADANQTFAGAAQQTCTLGSGTTTTTSGSGTTEEYITVCALSGDTTAADASGGPTYPINFTATGPGGNGGTAAPSGNLTITAATAKAEACLDPVAAGATTTFGSSAGGTANSYLVECYAESGSATGIVTAYPNSISITAGALPSDASFAGVSAATSCTLGSGTSTTTSGSGTTEEYITECNITENSVTADNGTYTANFTPSSLPATQSGTLTINVTGPSDLCLDPVAAGSTTTFREGIANSYVVECYGTGFGSANANNYPASITANNVTPAGTFLDGTANFGGTAPPTACTTSNGGTTTTSGSGLAEQYILKCTLSDTPTSASTTSTPDQATFTAQPGSAGGNTVTSGNLNVNIAPVTTTCIDPASGGITTTWYEGAGTQSYTVECESATGISGESAYPQSIAVSPYPSSIPGDATPTFGGSAQQSCAVGSGGTTTTSGTGTTEEYILECSLAATPLADDGGSYPTTFTPTDLAGNVAAASGTLNLNVSSPTSTCSAPGGAGTTTTFTDGTAGSYTVICYSQGFSSASIGNYPNIQIQTGSLPSSGHITFGGQAGGVTTCSVGSGTATTTTTTAAGTGVQTEYETECKIAGTPTTADNDPGPSYPPYALTFQAVPGANGGTAANSGTLNLKVVGTAPSALCSTCQSYYNAVAGVPFCFDYVVGGATVANGGLPLTSITPGATPANTTDYTIQNINLANGSAQLCGVMSAAEELTETTLNPVATNPWGSATQTYDMSTYSPCTWTNSDAGGEVNSTYDANVNVVQTGSQSSFGSSITGGVVPGTTRYYANCVKTGTSTADAYYLPGGSGLSVGASPFVVTNGGLGGYTNPSDPGVGSPLSDLSKACGGTVSTASSSTFGNFGSATPTYDFTFPSPWVNGGECTYGSGSESGTNSVGTDTDSFASCPPTQQDVNEGYVDCNTQAGIGTNANFGSGENAATGGPPYTTFNFTQDDQFFSGQPVPQASTVTLSNPDVQPGDTVTITGGTNWWGGSGASEPNSACSSYTGSGNSTANTYPEYGDGGTMPTTVDVCNTAGVASFGNDQYGEYYPTYAPQVYVGTNSTTAHAAGPVTSSVNIYGNTYYCTGALQSTNATAATNTANPCTMQVGGNNPQFSTACPNDLTTPAGAGGNTNNTNPCANAAIGGTFKVPAGLTPGTYNVYVDAMNTTPLPGNGPNSSLSAEPVNCPAQTNVTSASNGNLISNGTLNVTSTTSFASSGQVAVAIGPAATAGGATGTAVLNYTGTTGTAFTGVTVSPATVAVTGSATWTVQTGADVAPPSSCETSPDANLGSDEAVAQINVSGDMVVKSSTTNYSDSGYSAAGDVIDYQFAVTNTGGDTLTNVAVTDTPTAPAGALTSGPTCQSLASPSDTCSGNSITLLAGQTATFTGTYAVTQTDVDNGSVIDTASVSGNNGSSETISYSGNTVTVNASDAISSLSLMKTVSNSSSCPYPASPCYGVVGDTITYNYAVTNTGTVTVTGLGINDDLIPGADISCDATTLAPLGTTNCSGTYTVGQSDVDTGSVANTATASGTDFQGTVTSNMSAATVAASNATTSALVVKSTTTSGYSAAGDQIAYNYLVTNSGTTTLTNVTINDNLIPSVDIICPSPSLAPGLSETCTGSYTVTAADVTHGSVTNTATASGTSFQGTVNSGSSSVTVDVEAFGLSKTAVTQGYASAGDTINYTYQVANNGPDTISNISVSDNLVGSVTCPDSALASDTSEVCTGSYTTTSADVTNGSVTNSASATGTDPAHHTVTSATETATVDLETLSISKSAVTSAYGAIGDQITYHYLVTNTGPDTLTGIAVSDNLIAGVNCPNSSLASSASETCTGTYTVSQTDVDAGSVTNTASASGTDPYSDSVSSGSSSATVDASNATKGLSVAKSTTTTSYAAAGDSVDYQYVVTNTGTTTVTGISVADSLGITVTCDATTLAPTAVTNCSGSYMVSQADVTHGSVTNTATASGTASFLGSVLSSASNAVTVPSTYTTTMTAPTSSTSALGGPDADAALLTGNDIFGSPTAGTVTFYECGPTPSPTACTSKANQVGSPVSVSPYGGDTSVATSAPFTATSTGYWCFAGYYSGGGDYAASSDTGTDECYDVTAATSSNQTAPTDTTILLGQADTDLSTVTGNTAGGSPTGTVTYYACGPTSSGTSCTSKANQVGLPVTLSPAANHRATATSSPFTPNAVGYWCFAGYYSGDTNYKASSDTSVNECVNVQGPLTIITTSLPGATKNVAYSATVTARGGTQPYKWTHTGRLPRGLVLNKTTGVLSGTPKSSGTFTFTVKVMDSTGRKKSQHERASKVLSLVVSP